LFWLYKKEKNSKVTTKLVTYDQSDIKKK